jgi:hypothetical protein
MSRSASNRSRIGLGWLVALIVSVCLVAGPGCTEVTGEDPEPKKVIVEGIVVQGDTFRVEPFEGDDQAWEDRALPATVRLENEAGDIHQVACDVSGRFRVGPVLLKGAQNDRLVVSCPGSWTLRMSRLLPSDSELREEAGDVIEVRRKITLPPRGEARPGDGRQPS